MILRCYCTYKALAQAGTREKIQDAARGIHENAKIEIVPTQEIYMNMLGGWTEEQCDDTVYLVEIL